MKSTKAEIQSTVNDKERRKKCERAKPQSSTIQILDSWHNYFPQNEQLSA